MILVDYQNSIARLWDVSSGQLLREFKGDDSRPYLPYFKLSPDGSLVAMVSWDSVQTWWDLSTGNEVTFPDNMWGPTVAFSHDGSLFAILSPDEFHIWDLAKKKIIIFLADIKTFGYDAVFSPDDKLLLTGSCR